MIRLIARTAAGAAVLLLQVAGAHDLVLPGSPDGGIVYARVDEAWTALHAGDRVTFWTARHSRWMVGKEMGNGVTWAFSPKGHYAHPSVARNKWFETADGKSGVQQDLVCEAETSACDRLRAELPSLDAQMVPRSIASLLNGPDTAETYSKAIEIEPTYEPAYLHRGALYAVRGEFDRAVADFSKVIALNPASAKAHNDRCWVRAAANRDLPPALEDCDTALRLDPENANFMDTRGFLRLRLDRFDDAIADYDAALKLEPRLEEALYGRGLARHRKGDAEAGDRDMAAAKDIRPSVVADFFGYGLTK